MGVVAASLIVTVGIIALMGYGVFRMTRGRDVGWFKDLAAALQSTIIGGAVLIGGAWTLYTFLTLQQAAQARQTLEDSANKQLSIDVTLSVTPTRFTEAGRQGVVGIVVLHNNGSRSVTLDFRKAPVSLSKVHLTRAGVQATKTLQLPVFASVQVDKILTLAELTVPPGASKSVPFSGELEEGGLYMLCLAAPARINNENGKAVTLIAACFVEISPWDPRTHAIALHRARTAAEPEARMVARPSRVKDH